MGKRIDKFLLLMWKNLLLQWRHPKQTLVEILAPVFFLSLLVIVRCLSIPETYPAQFYSPYKNEMPVIKHLPTLRKIAWSPYNPALVKIMNDTINTISADENVSMQHIPFPDSSSLENYLYNELNLLITLAGVMFDDSLAGNVALTPIINITVRFPGETREAVVRDIKGYAHYTWKTNLLFPVYQTAGPRQFNMTTGAEPSYYFEGFLKLQQELSCSIISYFKMLQTNKPFNCTAVPVYMQRFPYPKWMYDKLLIAMEIYVGLVIMLSFLYTCISTVRVIATEKERQLKEAMKIMGLPNWLHWTAWFVKSFVMMFITIILIVVLLKARWYPDKDYSIFSESNPFVIFLFLVFFICPTITFSFAISVFFSKANIAATLAGIAWFLSYFPFSFLRDKYDTLSLTEKLLASLCSNSAMAYGFQLMLMFEGIGEGLQWHNVWKTTTPDDNLMLGHLMIMLTIDTVIYLLVALYVEAVFPGQYGVPQVWYFPVTPSYWCGQPHYVGVDNSQDNPITNEFFEKEPSHLSAGITIKHLRKQFSKKKVAVKDLSLNVYQDQITVLLGHNGAGKTTTMSMLTGIISPTGGTAIVGGYDIRTDMKGVRNSLGLCPQHNILFEKLTVKEHLYFYSRLKGLTKEKSNEEIKKYIELLELKPKEHAQSQTLSGGMQRKLSVGVALCGNSKVVIFDEPTSGMDPAARRALWDLLQSQKKDRTILLTTHFMDEADLLGDRIAIMVGGQLQCCGSSFFLKKKYGAGYHLIMDKSKHCDVNLVTDLLRKYIPNIHVESNIGSELSYLLSEEESPVFEEMFNDLEINSDGLGILSYGISLTTLEEVFIKVGADHGQEKPTSPIENRNLTSNYQRQVNDNQTSSRTANDDIKHSNIIQSHENGLREECRLNLGENLLDGWALWLNQVRAMLMKRGLSILRSWLLFIIQNSIPILLLVLAIIVVRGLKAYRHLSKLKIELDSYDNPVTVVTHNHNNAYARNYIDFLRNDMKLVTDWKNNNLSRLIFDKTETNTSTVRLRYITGATFNKDNSITAWFNNEPYHSPPLALQLVMNTILREEVSPHHSIQFFNYPLPLTLNTRLIALMRVSSMGFQIAFNIGFGMAFVSSFYIMFYIRERINKAKHLQFVSGVGVIAFWGSSFICDMLTFIFTSLCIIVTLIIFQEDGFSTPAELCRTFSVMLYFGLSMLPMMYLASYLFESPSAGYTRMTLVNICTGVAGFLIVQILNTPELELHHIADVLHWILLLVPHYSLSSGIRDMHVLYSTHSLCNRMLQHCIDFDLPNFLNLTPQLCKQQICKTQQQCCTMTTNYYDWESPGIGRNVLFSCVVGILLIGILIPIEYRVFENCLYQIRDKYSHRKPPILEQEDSDVLNEKLTIRNANMEEIISYNLVMRDVTKYYGNFVAVNSLCLAINKYECFGLLGVNGAGKTSTFKMMTGDIKFSWGDAWINGLSLKTEMKKVHRLIGYCPQFDALLDDLTCRETIIIFGLLRGITMTQINIIAKKLSQDFDFELHLDKKVKQLSGGNKRKLSTAVAMIGDPLILYLDEPTTGMDPATKRYIWNVLCKVRDNGKCIVLTSHSMEECEALCTRLAIMVNGSFMCLGSTQHLKSKFSEGYTLVIKVRKSNDYGELQSSDLEPIEKFIKVNFRGAIVREKHQELITFYIADKSLPWSKMFGIMEKAKRSLKIEDYRLGQCSLEQIFLTFTKYQRSEFNQYS